MGGAGFGYQWQPQNGWGAGGRDLGKIMDAGGWCPSAQIQWWKPLPEVDFITKKHNNQSGTGNATTTNSKFPPMEMGYFRGYEIISFGDV